jgi:hypothetical protein
MAPIQKFGLNQKNPYSISAPDSANASERWKNRGDSVNSAVNKIDSCVRFFGLFSLSGVASYGAYYPEEKLFNDTVTASTRMPDITAGYGIARGILQFMDGASMLLAVLSDPASDGKRKYIKVITSMAQILGGLLMVIGGSLYEHLANNTNLILFCLGLGVSAVAKAIKIVALLNEIYSKESENRREYENIEIIAPPILSLVEGAVLIFAMVAYPSSGIAQGVWAVANLIAPISCGFLAYSSKMKDLERERASTASI